MPSHYWKILLRILIRNPVYSMINILGLTLGLACSLLIFLWIHDELTFEEFHPDAERIYRILTLKLDGNDLIKTPVTALPLAGALKADFPQIAHSTFIKLESGMPLEYNGKIIEGTSAYIDDSFFSVFTGFEFTEGSRETGFGDAGSVIISENMSRKLFGDESALGKTIACEKIDREIFTVGGVVRIPRKSHIYFDIVLPITRSRFLSPRLGDWKFRESTSTYIKLLPRAEFSEETLEDISGFLSRHVPTSDKLVFQPITDIHLHSDYEYYWDQESGNIRSVLVFSALALLILIIAALNWIILSTVRSMKRAREVGVKKVLGSGKQQLIIQYMSESVIQSILAVFLGMMLVWLLIPWFNNLVDKDIGLILDLRMIVSLLCFGFIVGLLSGYYPALYLSAVSPVFAFRGGSKSGSTSGLLNIFITLQYIVSIGMIICTLYIHKQLAYIENKDLGFNRENILIIPTGLWYNMDNFKQEILKNPDIMSATACMNSPVDFYWENRDITWDGEQPDNPVTMTEAFVDEDFAATYGLEMVKGSFLSFRFEDYWKAGVDTGATASANTAPVVINETAWKIMGFEDPIGQVVNNRYLIVGVIRDFHFKPLQERIAPLLMTYNPEAIFSLNVRIREENQSSTIAFIEEIYNDFRPTRGFSYSFLDDDLNNKYESEQYQASLFLYFTFLSILISCLGVLGLTGYSVKHRIKEVTMRKAYGATSLQILVLFVKNYSKWVPAAFIISCPISWYFLGKWSQAFAYRTELSWWIFVLSGLMTFLIATMTICIISYRDASKNPAESLRYE